MKKKQTGWSSSMRRPEGDLEVRCLTNDEGHVWMHRYDPLPPAVRRRLAGSDFNICPACMDIEAHRAAGQRQPTVATYFKVIEKIERILQQGTGE